MGWLRDLGSILVGDVESPTKRLKWGRIEDVDWVHDSTPVKPGAAYMQWWLQAMWIQTERSWMDHFAPMAYSSVKLTYGDREVEIPASLGDFKFANAGDLKNIQDALLLNYPMTRLLPYNGGSVEINAALVRLRTSNGLKDMMSAMDQLAKVLAVPQLSAVVNVAGPVVNTLDTVLGQSQEQLALGLHQAFRHGGQEPLRAGYYLAAHYDSDDELIPQLKVQRGGLHWRESGNPVREFDYMLFRLERHEQRDDLEALSSIFDSMKKAEEAATNDRLDEARGYVRQASLTAFNSLDLTTADRRRVPLALRARFDEFLSVAGIVGSGASADPAERTLKQHISATTADDALKRSDADVLESILAL